MKNIVIAIIVTATITISLSAFAGAGPAVDLDNIKPQETGHQGVIDTHTDEKDPETPGIIGQDPCTGEDIYDLDIGYDDAK